MVQACFTADVLALHMVGMQSTSIQERLCQGVVPMGSRIQLASSISNING